MKASMYFNYTLRSLLRGGQRTILAIFCVAVGVMAVVALQLVGFMLQNSLTTNVRELNGGDISVTASGLPLKNSDLSFFTQLKTAGKITAYTAVLSANGSLSAVAPSTQTFPVEAVDASSFPLIEQPAFIQPTGGTVAGLLKDNQVLVTQDFIEKYQKQRGDALTIYIKTSVGSGETLHVTIAGIVPNAGMFAQVTSLLLISIHDYQAAAPANLLMYNQVYITTADQAHTDLAARAIDAHFPLALTQTSGDVLKSERSSIDLISKFLEIAGLLSLLIGGVGIVNTMQVQLSRRKTEIAMLKTSGYHRRDLYLLFGLETGLLGLIGGILGSVAAIGVSAIVRNLMLNLGVNLDFLLSPWIIGGGTAIGLATSLIFGLLPIVQAASVRPLNVIRDQEMRGAGSGLLTICLLLLLSVLFCALASVILNNDLLLGVETTYATFAFLLVLSALFSLIMLAVSKLPVPERLNFKQIALVLPGLILSALVYLKLPAFGLCLLVGTLLGVVIVFLPRSWKVIMKMALRNLGRRRGRTATTMLALFIGIFGIALVVGVGQDLQTQVATSLAQNQPYNLVAETSGRDTGVLRTHLHTIPGLNKSNEDLLTQVQLVAIDRQSPQAALPAGRDRQEAAMFLSQVEGYNPAQSDLSLSIVQGRDLNAGDAGTNNIIVSAVFTSQGWLGMKLRPGDTLTFASADGKVLKTMTIVGIISEGTSFETSGKILAPLSLVNQLGSKTGVNTLFYLKVDPAQLTHAEDELGRIVPDAAIQDLSTAGTAFIQQLNSIMDMLVAIASLSVIAAVIIIANAVALAMLERRRELGILKSVGYTSGTVLSEVLAENGIIGAVGAFMATLLATGGVILLGNFLFSSSVSIGSVLVISLIAGAAVLAMLTAMLVAWGSVRVRPLAVLRYE